MPLVHAQGLPTLEDRRAAPAVASWRRAQPMATTSCCAAAGGGLCSWSPATHSEIHTGRKTWGHSASTVAVGGDPARGYLAADRLPPASCKGVTCKLRTPGLQQDDTTFLPRRLSRQPVVVRGWRRRMWPVDLRGPVGPGRVGARPAAGLADVHPSADTVDDHWPPLRGVFAGGSALRRRRAGSPRHLALSPVAVAHRARVSRCSRPTSEAVH